MRILLLAACLAVVGCDKPVVVVIPAGGNPAPMPAQPPAMTASEAGPIVDNLLASGMATKISKFGGDMTEVWVTDQFKSLPRDERVKIARAINFMKGGTVLFYDAADTTKQTHIGKLYDVSKRLEWPGE